MTTEHEQVIEQIAVAVPQVAQEHEKYIAARSAEDAAEVAVLERVFAIVQPALRAISSRPVIYRRSQVDGPDLDERRAEWIGVYLGEVPKGPARLTGPRDASGGDLGGTDYYLCADGKLRSLDFEGRWSCWVDTITEWSATVADATTEEALNYNGLDTILAALLKALQSQLHGAKPDATKRAQQRVEKLQAVLALLK